MFPEELVADSLIVPSPASRVPFMVRGSEDVPMLAIVNVYAPFPRFRVSLLPDVPSMVKVSQVRFDARVSLFCDSVVLVLLSTTFPMFCAVALLSM